MSLKMIPISAQAYILPSAGLWPSWLPEMNGLSSASAAILRKAGPYVGHQNMTLGSVYVCTYIHIYTRTCIVCMCMYVYVYIYILCIYTSDVYMFYIF